VPDWRLVRYRAGDLCAARRNGSTDGLAHCAQQLPRHGRPVCSDEGGGVRVSDVLKEMRSAFRCLAEDERAALALLDELEAD